MSFIFTFCCDIVVLVPLQSLPLSLLSLRKLDTFRMLRGNRVAVAIGIFQWYFQIDHTRTHRVDFQIFSVAIDLFLTTISLEIVCGTWSGSISKLKPSLSLSCSTIKRLVAQTVIRVLCAVSLHFSFIFCGCCCRDIGCRSADFDCQSKNRASTGKFQVVFLFLLRECARQMSQFPIISSAHWLHTQIIYLSFYSLHLHHSRKTEWNGTSVALSDALTHKAHSDPRPLHLATNEMRDTTRANK